MKFLKDRNMNGILPLFGGFVAVALLVSVCGISIPGGGEATPTPAPTPVMTATPIITPTPVRTPVHTPTRTPTPTPAFTPTPTPTPAPTPTPTPAPQLCPETDAGMDLEHKGITSGVYQGVQGNWPDYCFDAYHVFEFYCPSEGQVSGATFSCATGCDGGQCAAAPAPSPEYNFPPDECTDTDGGVDHSVKGTVYGRNKLTGTFKMETDKCDGPSLLIEEFCDPYSHSAEFQSSLYTCPYGCADGACNPG